MPQLTLTMKGLGPIQEAKVSFGDLTVFTGPQASGKSIALQTLKLVIDQNAIVRTMSDQGLVWADRAEFLDLFYGEGMRSLWRDATEVTWLGRTWTFDRIKGAKAASIRKSVERVSYIPAQRVMSLRDGWTRSFGEYRAGDPFVLREFSQRIHEIVQGELSRSDVLFPRSQRFNKQLRSVVTNNILGGFELHVDTSTLQKRFVIRDPAAGTTAPPLPFLTWSSGQREFVPLLLGLYRLMPAGGVHRREHLQWAVIEEPEMALHPRAIAATMAFVLELMRRGYKVVLSTHSTQVLDVIWGLQRLQHLQATREDVRQMIHLGSGRSANEIAQKALEADLRVHYFEPGAMTQDISDLDPSSPRDAESGWGGITGFSENVADVVAEVVRRGMEHVPDA